MRFSLMPFRQKSVGDQEALVCCFHFGRCGSTLLGEMAVSHGSIDWQGELFHELHEGQDKSNPWKHLTGPISTSEKPIFGFETKFQHLDVNGLNVPLNQYIEDLEELGFSKFIVLKTIELSSPGNLPSFAVRKQGRGIIVSGTRSRNE